MKSTSFRLDMLWFFTTTADVEVTVPHSLGRVPLEAFVVYRDKAGTLYRGTTAWSADNIFVKSATASVGFAILLI